MHNWNHDAIKENLVKLERSKDSEEETFVKLLMVYFMATIFFSNTSLNVSTFTVRYADNLASLGCYTWAHAIHKWMMADIPLMATHT